MSYIYIYIYIYMGLKNTPTASLQKGKIPSISVLDMILNNLELWGMWSIPLLLSLQGPLWPGAVASDRDLFMSQIELNCVLMLNWIVWNRTVYMFKMDSALNIQQWLIYHKTKPNQTILFPFKKVDTRPEIFWGGVKRRKLCYSMVFLRSPS